MATAETQPSTRHVTWAVEHGPVLTGHVPTWSALEHFTFPRLYIRSVFTCRGVPGGLWLEGIYENFLPIFYIYISFTYVRIEIENEREKVSYF